MLGSPFWKGLSSPGWGFILVGGWGCLILLLQIAWLILAVDRFFNLEIGYIVGLLKYQKDKEREFGNPFEKVKRTTNKKTLFS